jgi:hypothetical protein
MALALPLDRNGTLATDWSPHVNTVGDAGKFAQCRTGISP